MALTHGQLPPIDDLSVVDFSTISLRYGPTVINTGAVRYSSLAYDGAYGTYSNNCIGLKGGLRRYVFNYNSTNNTYEHVQTYKTCRSLYENHRSITDVSLLNCVFNIHGAALSGASEAPPQGLAAKLNEVFARPIIGQNLFIDCVSRVLCVDPTNPSYNDEVTIVGIYKTDIFRYGVMRNNQVFYFKNSLDFKNARRIDEPLCQIKPPMGSCFVNPNTIINVSQNQCNILGGVWTINPE